MLRRDWYQPTWTVAQLTRWLLAVSLRQASSLGVTGLTGLGLGGPYAALSGIHPRYPERGPLGAMLDGPDGPRRGRPATMTASEGTYRSPGFRGCAAGAEAAC